MANLRRRRELTRRGVKEKVGGEDPGGAFEPDWRVVGIPVQPTADLIARYGLEKGRRAWMYRHVCWTAGLVNTHLGLGYSENMSRLLQRLELELALELMIDHGMTMEANAEQAWSSKKRVEMIELQHKVIARYDELVAEFEPGKVPRLGLKSQLGAIPLKKAKMAEKSLGSGVENSTFCVRI